MTCVSKNILTAEIKLKGLFLRNDLCIETYQVQGQILDDEAHDILDTRHNNNIMYE